MDEEKGGQAALVLESIRLIAAHYGLWFAETVHQFGVERALEAERKAGDAALGLAFKRLGNDRNPFEKLPKKELETLLEALGRLWLGMDGVWFQAVESWKAWTAPNASTTSVGPGLLLWKLCASRRLWTCRNRLAWTAWKRS